MVYNQSDLYTLKPPNPRIIAYQIKAQRKGGHLKDQQLQLHKLSYPKDPVLALDKGQYTQYNQYTRDYNIENQHIASTNILNKLKQIMHIFSRDHHLRLLRRN